MTTSLEHLIDAAALTAPAEVFDWTAAATRLEMPVPHDYRTLLDAGGAGVWFDYIRLFAPHERYLDKNLLDSAGVFEDLQLFWEEGYSAPPADLADGDRLVAWASTALGGQKLYWRTGADTPVDEYPVYVDSADGDAWERFDMTATDLLSGVLHGDVRSDLFADFLLDVGKVFSPYGPPYTDR